MSLDRHWSLSAAARAIGVDRSTLKKWLLEDLAMPMPYVKRGSKVMLRERDIEIVVRRRMPMSDWKLMRRNAA